LQVRLATAVVARYCSVLMNDKSELRWQCRRGMRELDILLERYLQLRFDRAAVEEKLAFRVLLALQDPDLAGYLLRGEPHKDPASATLIARILGND